MTTDKTTTKDPAAQAAEAQAKAATEQLAADKAASDKAANKSQKTDSLVSLDVLVRRDEVTTVPATVFEHELPILRALFGTDFVQEIGRDTVEVADFDANDELARLQRKYNTKERDVVGLIYGNDPRRIAQEAGVSFKSGDARKPAASSQKPAKKKVIGAKK